MAQISIVLITSDTSDLHWK